MPSIQSTDNVRANADLLRRVAAAIGLTGTMLVEVCQRVILDVQAGVAPIHEAVRIDPSSDTVEDA